jgi:hypothetical protein
LDLIRRVFSRASPVGQITLERARQTGFAWLGRLTFKGMAQGFRPF